MGKYRDYMMKAAMLWAGCLAVLVLAYVLLLGPQRRLRRHLQSELAQKEQQYIAAQTAAKEQTQIRLKEGIEKLKGRFADFVVEFENSANLTFDISRIAGTKDIKSFSIKSQENQNLSALPDCTHICENRINVSCTAGFNQFAAFLNALERHRPVLFVDKFTITYSSQNESGPEVNLNLVALVTKPQDG